ncbi:hypothetical protein [Cupriavidus pauculus]|jgi:hypothetical protein|uniref:hypothetical protein n=1 Tax=Cupriavidus pauculus TaxID=82633 RepID=UPI001247CC2B|nr:hypothetical protein [Cupriavidus pauculus]KAB0599784.1 hypothetical protein F7R19_24280 [Cupriavidus pauculus]MCM3603973.1 hypothetical protein [Cupriavidus pauculus]
MSAPTSATTGTRLALAFGHMTGHRLGKDALLFWQNLTHAALHRDDALRVKPLDIPDGCLT